MEKLMSTGNVESAVHIRLMTKEDVHQVGEIDREAFPTMWPPINFNHELTNRLAHYLVATDGFKPSGPQPAVITPEYSYRRSFLGIKWPLWSSKPHSTPPSSELIRGFLGMWMMVDEAHIINIAVRESARGKGIGELLLISGVEMAVRLNATVATLEVRVSNTIAQNLYVKYGFNNVGSRKKYYTDNNEDALIMTTDLLSGQSFQEKFQALKTAHLSRLGVTGIILEK
jgi:[ribosomal protein S18]-alanine N-acetyltransferase